MFCNKKIESREETEEEKPIDFLWMRYMGVNRLGFSHREAGRQYFGGWIDLFELFKEQYNFETKRGLYRLTRPEGEDSLDAI